MSVQFEITGEPNATTEVAATSATRVTVCSVVTGSISLEEAAPGGTTVVTGPAAYSREALRYAAERLTGKLGVDIIFADYQLRGAEAADSGRTGRGAPPGFARSMLDDRYGEIAHDYSPGLATLVAALSRWSPVAVIVDETGLADPACLAFLAELSCHAGSVATVAVFAWQGAEYPTLGDKALRLGVPCCQAQPRLSPGTVAELFRSRLPEDLGTSLAPLMYERVGGNASLVAAALDDLDSAHETDVRGGEVGAELARAVWRELCSQPNPMLLDAAQAIAVLGEHGDPAVLSQVLTVPIAHLSDLFSELAKLDMITSDHRLRPHIEAAVRQATAPEVLRRLHLRIADVLYADGAPSRTVAEHLLAIAEAPRPWAPDALRAAAEEAVREHQVAEAAAMLTLALEWSAEPDTRSDIRARLLDAQWRSDPGGIGELLGPLTASARDGILPPHRSAWLARLLVWHGRVDDARDLLAHALPQDTARAEVDRMISSLWIRHVFPSAARTPAAPLRTELIVDDCLWLPRAVVLSDLVAAGDFEAADDEALQLMLRLLPHVSDLEAGQLALFTLLSHERPDLVQDWYERVSSDWGEVVPPHWQCLLHSVQAMTALLAGELAIAEEHSRRATELVDGGQWNTLVALPRAIWLLVLAEQNRYADAAAVLTAQVPETITRSPYGLLYLRACGVYHLATGSPQLAADDFIGIGEITTSWGMEVPGLLPWRVDLAEAYLRLGDREAAGKLAREHLDLPLSPWSWTRGRAMRLLSETLPEAERLPLLGDAVANLEHHGGRLEYARALELLAREYQRTGRLSESRRARQRAKRLSRHLSTGHVSTSTERAADMPAGSAAESRPLLTRAEVKVARLASRGYTNREISSMLYITISTVEQHLTRVYRKLDIKRRDQLDALSDSL